MRRVFIIVGRSGSRKSSIIRALTGVGQPKILQVVRTDGTTLDIYVHHSSLQEVKMTPDEFIARVEALDGNPDVLVALRTKSSQNQKFPNAQKYALRFERASWQIAGVAALAGGFQHPLTDNSPQPILMLGRERTPSNRIANVIRSVWNWL